MERERKKKQMKLSRKSAIRDENNSGHSEFFFFEFLNPKKLLNFAYFVDSVVVYEIAGDLTIDTSIATAAVICRRNFARYSPIFDILIAYTTIQKLKNFFLRLSIILLPSSIFSFFLQTSLKGILIN